MKKVLIGLVVLIVLVFGGLKIFEITNYGGTTYYTKITNAGQQATDHDQDGNKYTIYAYDLPSYDEKGSLQQLKFNANQDRPLKMNAYLKVIYNDKKGVTDWQRVPRAEVPKAALAKLD
ncbi:YxeA family protein [Lacticaseibacillus paracasei]|uniref:YxeA family protein n=1 Tax=Lacticaseibacillus paracasei TaxID=1597 RepID=UPI002ADEF88D|nr:YxeA family protein [Lacticaseibacillus paracasei]MEA0973136.1 YxeA family protein [Lacticaseibacillus paracasei]